MAHASIHLPRLSRDHIRTLWGCITRVLADSNRTEDIIVAEEIASQRQLEVLRDSGLFDRGEGAELLHDRPILADTDLDELRGLPPGSLGREFVDFLDRHGLDYELTRQPTPYTDDSDAAYLLHRIRQNHDLWHTLLGLGVEGYEEVLVHSFSLAQTGFPSSVLIVALGGIKHMVLERRWTQLRKGVRRAYALGEKAAPLVPVYWERRWAEPLVSVRQELGIVPYDVH